MKLQAILEQPNNLNALLQTVRKHGAALADLYGVDRQSLDSVDDIKRARSRKIKQLSENEAAENIAELKHQERNILQSLGQKLKPFYDELKQSLSKQQIIQALAWSPVFTLGAIMLDNEFAMQGLSAGDAGMATNVALGMTAIALKKMGFMK